MSKNIGFSGGVRKEMGLTEDAGTNHEEKVGIDDNLRGYGVQTFLCFFCSCLVLGRRSIDA